MRAWWVLILLSGFLGIVPGTGQSLAQMYPDADAGRPTAWGEPYDPRGFGAAHPDLRLGTRLVVENPANGRKTLVRITDRPSAGFPGLLVSRAAAEALGLPREGSTAVTWTVLSPGADPGFLPVAVPRVWFQIGAFQMRSHALSVARDLLAQQWAPLVRWDQGLYHVYLDVAESEAPAVESRLASTWKGYRQLNKPPGGTLVKLSIE